jgi:GNAT superfamily N-acetyltransferase
VFIEPRAADDPELIALVAAQQRELVERELGAGAEQPPQYPVRDGAHYLVVVLDGRAVGCGALQRLDERVAELKRMYVLPALRGRGISRRIVAALEELALAGEYSTLVVETGDFLPEAMGLYASCGYRRIPPFGEYADNPHSVCFEKSLTAAAALPTSTGSPDVALRATIGGYE